MARLDFGEYLSDDRLPLDNICTPKHENGKTYYVPSPSAKFALQLRRMMELWGGMDESEQRAPNDEDIKTLLEMSTNEAGEPVEFHRKLLGPVYDELVADGLSAERLTRVSNVVMAYYAHGEQVARALLAGPGKPSARPNRATRRTAKKTAGSRSRQGSGASATRTRKPASTASSTPPSVSPEPEAAAAV
jgi:hypothetical protein